MIKYLGLALLIFCFASYALPTTSPTTSSPAQATAQQQFIAEMVKEHHFKQSYLQQLFAQIKQNQTVIDLMNKPYEGKPWHEYQKFFVSDIHVKGGVKFWREYRTELHNVSTETGVPQEVIVAIIGVESRYGQYKGTYPAFETLYTFAFYYPRREAFFRNELKQFLILCREQNWDPLLIKGSYAAALGQPQFMPSSYRLYAKGYKNQSKVNLFDFEPDVIASVGNYFMVNGWQKGQPVVTPAIITGDQFKKLSIIDRTTPVTKPKMTLGELGAYGVKAEGTYSPSEKALLMSFELVNSQEYWLGFHNFYVITRYNRSPLYAMAVYQLAEKIAQQYHQTYPK